MVSFLVVVVLSYGQVADISKLPERLQKIIQDRSAEHTSLIEWTVEKHTGLKAGMTERFVTQTIGNSLHQYREVFNDVSADDPYSTYRQELGDSMDARARPGLRVRRRFGEPVRVMTYEGDYLFHEGIRTHAHLTIPKGLSNRQPSDVRGFGVGPHIGFGTDPLGLANEGFYRQDITYTESTDGRYDRITTSEFADRRYVEWVFDREQGNQPVRVTLYIYGEPSDWTETTFQEIDGRWYPQSVNYYQYSKGKENGILANALVITHASFDEPWHRQEPFDLSDANIVFGTGIFTYYSSQAPEDLQDAIMYWSGTEKLTKDEFEEMLYGYNMPIDPSIVAYEMRFRNISREEYDQQFEASRQIWFSRYKIKHGTPFQIMDLQQSTQTDEWDAYVVRFIEKHALKDMVEKQANDLLKKAKTLRDVYRRKYLKRLKQSAQATSSKNPFETMKKRIFERMLVRGLKRLAHKQNRLDKIK